MPKRTRERLGEPRRYTFKLYPTPAQAAEITDQCRMVASLWNGMMERQESLYSHTRGQRGVTHREGKAHLSFFDLTAEITQLRHACPEWAALSVWTAHRVADAQVKAFDAFFRRAKQGAGAQSGYPRYRRVRDANWLPHRFQSGCKFLSDRAKHWRLRLKGVTDEIRAMGEFPSQPLAWNDADIRYRAGTWWLSVGVELAPRRSAGAEPVIVRLDTIDVFATVNGSSVPAWAVGRAGLPPADDRIADIQQAMSDRKSDEYAELRQRKARIEARRARQRREALHEWTTQVVRMASDLTVIRPADIKEATTSGRGTARDPGAAVRLKAEMNRHVLDQAPAAAVQMLAYKAAEAGIPYREVEHDDLDAGNLIVGATKETRKLKRSIRNASRSHGSNRGGEASA